MKAKPQSEGDRQAKSPQFPFKVQAGNAIVTIYPAANCYPLFMVAIFYRVKAE